MGGPIGEFEHLLLLAVLRLGDDAYGVAIRQVIEEATGRRVTAGAVYTALGRLEARGLVASAPGETIPERTGMRRRYYRVLPAGARALDRTIRNLEVMSRGLKPQIARLAARAPKRD